MTKKATPGSKTAKSRSIDNMPKPSAKPLSEENKETRRKGK